MKNLSEISDLEIAGSLVDDRDEYIRQLKHQFEELEKTLSAFGERQFQLTNEVNEFRQKENAILRSLDSAVISIDINGKIININIGAEEIFGYKLAEVKGLNYQDIYGKNVPFEKQLLFTLESNGIIKGEEKFLVAKDGSKIPVWFKTALLFDIERNQIGALEVLDNLTEKKRLEGQIAHSKTLAALGEMSALVAHEIKNPLGAIAGYAAMLQDDLSSDPDKLPLVESMMKAITSLNKTVSSMLLYSRPMELNLEDVNIVEKVEEIIDFISIDDKFSNIKKEKIFLENNLISRIDRDKFDQVLLNIIKNGLQAIGEQIENGILTVTVKKIDADCRALLQKNEQMEDAVVVEIKDNGSGISKENMKSIFSPFFTTKTSDGTGLGLALSKKIIEFHNGTIKVVSTENVGTTFFIIIPA